MVEGGEEREEKAAGDSLSSGSQRPLEDASGLEDGPCLECGGQMLEGGFEPMKETWPLLEPPDKA